MIIVDAGEPDMSTPGQNDPVSLRCNNNASNHVEQAAARRFFYALFSCSVKCPFCGNETLSVAAMPLRRLEYKLNIRLFYKILLRFIGYFTRYFLGLM